MFSNVGMLFWRRSRTRVSFESFMDLRNAKISSGADLFPSDVLDKAVEKSSKVHDEAMRKAGSRDKLASHRKKLHFSATPHQLQQSKKPTWSSTGLSFRSSSSRRWKGKKF